jgi:AbrB family looped-hinge helix DNA binding protein
MATLPRISVVTERGQVSIPAHLRKELGLEKGRRLLWEKSGEQEIRVVVLPPAEPRGATAYWYDGLHEDDARVAR